MKKYFLSESDFTLQIIEKATKGIPTETYERKLVNAKHLYLRYTQEMDRKRKKQNTIDELLFPYFRKPKFMEYVFGEKEEYAAEFVRLYIRIEIIYSFMLYLLIHGFKKPDRNLSIVCRCATLAEKILDRDFPSYTTIEQALIEARVIADWGQP